MSVAEQFIQQGKLEGMQQGIQQGKLEGIQQGMQQGKLEGIQEGMQKGEKEGIQKGMIEVVKNMLKNDTPIEYITRVTNMSKNQIKDLSEQISLS